MALQPGRMRIVPMAVPDRAKGGDRLVRIMKTIESFGRPALPAMNLGRRGTSRWGVWAGLGLSGLLLPVAAQDFFPSVNPFAVPQDPALQQELQENRMMKALESQAIAASKGSQLSYYNIKLGPVLAWFRAGMMFRYQSNFNLVSSDNPTAAPEGNFTIGPAISGSLRYDISEKARIVLSTGLSYQWSLNNNQDQLVISPSSALDYQFSIGEVNFSVFNNTASASTATTDPTISGTGDSSLMNFNRVSNGTGMGAGWQPYRDTTVSGAYAFLINRGLGNDNFNQFNRNTQTFNLAVQQALSPVWTVGLSSQGNIINYLPISIQTSTNAPATQQRVQNDSHGWGVGPTATWRATQFIVVNALVNYTVQTYEQDSVVQDSTDFSGVTFNVSMDHTINPYLSQTISGGRSVNPGNGSNFTEITTMGYRLQWQIMPVLALTGTFRFNQFDQSGGGFAYFPYVPGAPLPPNFAYITDDDIVVVKVADGQQGQQYVFTLGTGYDLTEKLSLGVNYSVAIRDTTNQSIDNVIFGSYLTQSVVVSLAYKF